MEWSKDIVGNYLSTKFGVISLDSFRETTSYNDRRPRHNNSSTDTFEQS